MSEQQNNSKKDQRPKQHGDRGKQRSAKQPATQGQSGESQASTSGRQDNRKDRRHQENRDSRDVDGRTSKEQHIGRTSRSGHQGGDTSERRESTSSGGFKGSTCFTCNQKGHLSRNCPIGKSKDMSGNSSGGGGYRGSKCFNCNQPGHVSRECPAGRSKDKGPRASFTSGQERYHTKDRPKNNSRHQVSSDIKLDESSCTWKPIENVNKEEKKDLKDKKDGDDGSILIPKHSSIVPTWKGKKIKLMTNHFLMTINKPIKLYHFDVDIKRKEVQNEDDSSKASKNKRKSFIKPVNRTDGYKIFDAFLLEYGSTYFPRNQLGFDGAKNVYTPIQSKDLDGKKFSLQTKLSDEKTYDCDITFNQAKKKDDPLSDHIIDLGEIQRYYRQEIAEFPQEALQALEITLKFPSRSTNVFVKRMSIFPVNGDRTYLSNGLELAFGSKKSLRASATGITLVLERATCIFYKTGPALNFFQLVLDKRDPGDLHNFKLGNNYKDAILRRAFRGLKVAVTHLDYKRIYSITKLSYKSAAEEKFYWAPKDGGSGLISIAEFFKKRYNKTLKYPNLPCLEARNGSKLPIEVCEVVKNVPYADAITGQTQKLMIQLTADRPEERFQSLLKSRKNLSTDVDPVLQEYGINLDCKPLAVEGIVLDPPILLVDNNKKLYPENGKWNLKKSSLYGIKTFSKFCVINTVTFNSFNEKIIKNFVAELIKMAKEMKMCSLDEKNPYTLINVELDENMENNEKKMVKNLKNLKDQNFDYALIFINGDKKEYELVKRIGDTEICFITQCMKIKTASKPNPQLVSNMLMKINEKLGGTNQVLIEKSLPNKIQEDLMIIGADITHPGESDDIISSVAASVSSFNKHHTKYFASKRVQAKKTIDKSVQEIIVDFKGMVEEHLNNYKLVNKKLPKSILYLRDGVSDGQYDQVANQEVVCLEQPLKDNPTYKPKVIAFVISKRILTRTMPLNEKDGVGAMKNVPPGTTIDSIINHRYNFDYFQYCHNGIKGTSRPFHAYQLKDDHSLSPEEIFQLTFNLAHLFQRCTSSISIPAPVNYAHHVAYRVRQWLSSGSKPNLDKFTDPHERFAEELRIAEELNNKVNQVDEQFLRDYNIFT